MPVIVRDTSGNLVLMVDASVTAEGTSSQVALHAVLRFQTAVYVIGNTWIERQRRNAILPVCRLAPKLVLSF